MMNVDLDMPAATLYEAVSNRSGMPLEGFALYYRSKKLEGEAALSSWQVKKDAIIEVKTRGRGGAKEGGSSDRAHAGSAFWLKNVHDGRALCTLHNSDDRAHKGNQEEAIIYDYYGNATQHWKLVDEGGGRFSLRNEHDNRALCTLHNSDDRAHKGNQEKAIIYDYYGNATQHWELVFMDPPVQKKLGVLRLDGWSNPNIHDQEGHGKTGATAPKDGNTDNKYEGYVPLEGDIDDKFSYDFDFISEVAKGCTFDVLCNPKHFVVVDNPEYDPKFIRQLLPGVESAVKKLIKRGAQAIIGNCGLFMWLHATGVIEHAVDKVMKDLGLRPDPWTRGSVYVRPYVMLSSLTTLGSTLATLGVGTAQKEASASWWKSDDEVKTRECKVVVYTSNGDSCKAMLKAVPQLKGLKMITPYDDEEGDVLVVGLNGVVDDKVRPVIGLDGQVGGDSLNGFIAVKTGQPVFYDIVQPDMELVAKAVKQKYPSVCMAYVECTEVSAYSDTIRLAMQVPVFDPINLANDMIDAANNHNFHQVSNSERKKQVSATLHMAFNKLVKNNIVDALDVGTSDHPLHAERLQAREKLSQVKEVLSKRERETSVEEEPAPKAQRHANHRT